MAVVNSRTNIFIKPGFQSRLTAIMILLVIIVANLVGGITYLLSHERLERFFLEEYKLPIDMNKLARVLLPGVLISEILSIAFAAGLSVKITHTIAGPVYRMERVARGIGEGDLTNFIKLRQRDELKDLADSMNEMTMGLRNKVISLKENTSEVKEEIEKLKNSNSSLNLDEILQKLVGVEDTLRTFILEKESHKRLEVSDEEDDADEAEEKATEENENKTNESNETSEPSEKE